MLKREIKRAIEILDELTESRLGRKILNDFKERLTEEMYDNSKDRAYYQANRTKILIKRKNCSDEEKEKHRQSVNRCRERKRKEALCNRV